MIKVEQAEIDISETTVRALLAAIEKAKETVEFSEGMSPMPDGDMSMYQYEVEKRKRGCVLVSTPYSGIKYRVEVEVIPHSQEGLGYKLEELQEPKPSSCSGIILEKKKESEKNNTELWHDKSLSRDMKDKKQ